LGQPTFHRRYETMRRKYFTALALAVVGALALALGATASPQAGQMITITNVSVSPDRHVTVDWTGPPAAGIEHGALQIATKPDTGTDGDFFTENRITYDLLDKGQQHYVSTDALPAPGTYYVRVTGWWNGYSDDDYVNYGSVSSQVASVDAPAICAQVLVTPGHYVKKVVRKGRWVVHNGARTWNKPVYKKVWVDSVYRQNCH